MTDLKTIISKLELKDFKIVGNNLIIDKLDILNTNPKFLPSVKYNIIVSVLLADLIPKCIKSCNKLILVTTNRFDGYLPIVKDYIDIKGGKSKPCDVLLSNQECRNVSLESNKYLNSIKSNKILLGSLRSVIVDNLIVEGIGNNSILQTNILKCEGNLKINNFGMVGFGATKGFNSDNHKIEISNCDLLDLKYLDAEFNLKNLALSNIGTLIVSTIFTSDSILESDKLIFTNPNMEKLNYDSYVYKSIFLCNKCVISGKAYTKSNPYKGYLPNVKFK